jgi:Raf kinase inhibitor-like YbhB/YbcL family protein
MTGSALALLLLFCAAAIPAVSTASAAQISAAPRAQGQQALPDWSSRRFELHSSTFTNGSTLPQSTILNAALVYGTPPIVGCEGGNKSPELSWTNAPRGTRSFAIMLFDADASVVHWSIYNIPATTTSLPENAGTPTSSYGQQVFNDVADLPNYDGPCPPTSFPHHYVFTIYAIGGWVTLNAPPQLSPSFIKLPTGETLFQTLLEGRYHILGSATLTGLYGLPKGASQNAAAALRHAP